MWFYGTFDVSGTGKGAFLVRWYNIDTDIWSPHFRWFAAMGGSSSWWWRQSVFWLLASLRRLRLCFKSAERTEFILSGLLGPAALSASVMFQQFFDWRFFRRIFDLGSVWFVCSKPLLVWVGRRGGRETEKPEKWNELCASKCWWERMPCVCGRSMNLSVSGR